MGGKIMSKFKLVAIVVGFIFFCPLLTNAQDSCGVPVPLYAGQTIHVGNVIVNYTSGSEGEGPDSNLRHV